MMIRAPIHLFDKSCTIKRVADTVDSGGGPIETQNNHLTGVLCRIQPVSGSENVRYGRENNRITHDVFVEGGQDITAEDFVIVDGLTLDIQFARDYDRQGALMLLECEETKP